MIKAHPLPNMQWSFAAKGSFLDVPPGQISNLLSKFPVSWVYPGTMSQPFITCKTRFTLLSNITIFSLPIWQRLERIDWWEIAHLSVIWDVWTNSINSEMSELSGHKCIEWRANSYPYTKKHVEMSTHWTIHFHIMKHKSNILYQDYLHFGIWPTRHFHNHVTQDLFITWKSKFSNLWNEVSNLSA